MTSPDEINPDLTVPINRPKTILSEEERKRRWQEWEDWIKASQESSGRPSNPNYSVDDDDSSGENPIEHRMQSAISVITKDGVSPADAQDLYGLTDEQMKDVLTAVAEQKP